MNYDLSVLVFFPTSYLQLGIFKQFEKLHIAKVLETCSSSKSDQIESKLNLFQSLYCTKKIVPMTEICKQNISSRARRTHL